MYCSPLTLNDYVLPQVLSKMEDKNNGITARTIVSVNNEIDEILEVKYSLPLVKIPERLVRIASTIAAYRIVGSITTVIKTSAESDNEYLYLQRQYNRAVLELDSIMKECANGNDPLGLEGDDTIQTASDEEFYFPTDVLRLY